jgi:hypothetical protein
MPGGDKKWYKRSGKEKVEQPSTDDWLRQQQRTDLSMQPEAIPAPPRDLRGHLKERPGQYLETSTSTYAQKEWTVGRLPPELQRTALPAEATSERYSMGLSALQAREQLKYFEQQRQAFLDRQRRSQVPNIEDPMYREMRQGWAEAELKKLDDNIQMLTKQLGETRLATDANVENAERESEASTHQPQAGDYYNQTVARTTGNTDYYGTSEVPASTQPTDDRQSSVQSWMAPQEIGFYGRQSTFAPEVPASPQAPEQQSTITHEAAENYAGGEQSVELSPREGVTQDHAREMRKMDGQHLAAQRALKDEYYQKIANLDKWGKSQPASYVEAWKLEARKEFERNWEQLTSKQADEKEVLNNRHQARIALGW